ncbi:penicillin-binding protein activator [Desulfosarcina sp. OttesenSCG-928-A07]|nr:penicillin-binding protein activator [Desulfosarcina sp. OttesenSCG-928-A07]
MMNRTKQRLFYMLSVMGVMLLVNCSSSPLIAFPDETPKTRNFFQGGERAFEAGRYDDAMEQYQKLLEDSPSSRFSENALYKIGRIYRITGRNNEALTTFSRLVRDFPKSPMAGKGMAEFLAIRLQDGKAETVIAQGNQFIQNTPAKRIGPELYGVMGDACSTLGNHLEAAKFYYQTWRSATTSGERSVALSKLDRAMDHLQPAEIQKLLSDVMDRSNMGVLLYQLGMAFKEAEQYDAALEVFDAVARQFPAQLSYQEARDEMLTLSTQRQYKPHTIGCLLPLSGSHEVVGQQVLDAIELAVTTLNQQGVPLKLVARDTQSDPKLAERGVDELNQEGVGVILGPMITAEAAAAKAQSQGIPIIVFTQRDGVTDLGSYVFRHFITPAMQVQTLATVAVDKLGVKHFAILYPDEIYGQRYMTLFRQAVSLKGGQVVAIDAYNPKENDFSAHARKLAALFQSPSRTVPAYSPTGTVYPPNVMPAAEPAQWDPVIQGGAIFIPDAPRASSMIISQLAFYDVNTPYLLGTNLWDSAALLASSTPYMKKALIVDGFFAQEANATVQAFVSDFKENFGRTPDMIEAMAYDSVMMVSRALEVQNALDSRRSLRDSLLQLRGFDGVSGKTAFFPNGEPKKELKVLQVKDGRFVLLPTPWMPETP